MKGGKSSGLRLRMRRASRQIAEQHRQLQGLVRAVRAALESGDRDELEALPGRFRAALESHFALEEEVFFPALHGLYPAGGAELDRLASDHAALLERLAALEELLRVGGFQRFGRGFAELVAELERHERFEEGVVDQLAGSVG